VVSGLTVVILVASGLRLCDHGSQWVNSVITVVSGLTVVIMVVSGLRLCDHGSQCINRVVIMVVS
jgi:hypothetical protein